MSGEDDEGLARIRQEASQHVFATFSSGSQPSQTGGSCQIPNSDNDESLEQLAEQQEEEYWSMLGDEEYPLPRYCSSSTPSMPVVASRIVRSTSPLLHDPDVPVSPASSSLPSPLFFHRSTSKPQYSAHEAFGVASSQARWIPTESVDRLLLQSQRKTSLSSVRKLVHALNSDEGYQTKTDSDHVTSIGDAPANLKTVCTPPQSKEASRRSSLGTESLPPNRPASSAHYEIQGQEPLNSSPLSSPTGSLDFQDTEGKGTSSKSAGLAQGDGSVRHTSEALVHLGEAPARQLRQRKAVQLAPYSTEFSKFASLANKNSWQGIISAGLKQAFLEKEREKAKSQERQRDLSGDWLTDGNEAEEEQESDFSQPSSETTFPRRKRRSTPLDDVGLFRHSKTSAAVERYSRTHQENDWDPIANRLKAARKPTGIHRQVARSSRASTSRTTLEDLEKSALRRKERKSAKQASNPRKVKPALLSEQTDRAAQISEARRAGLLPSDVETSSSERDGTSPRRPLTDVNERPSHHRNAQASFVIIEASDTTQSDSDLSVGGDDSPDRPVAIRKDRFTLKGKRKRAAMSMMPAVALKRAEADLQLMEREMEENREVRLEEPNHDKSNGTVSHISRVKRRWQPKNINRPFRYITELSTDDSETGSDRDTTQMDDDDETQAAVRAWTSMAAGKPQVKHNSGNEYWDRIIGRILLRKDGHMPTAATKRRRRPRVVGESSTTTRPNAPRQIGESHQPPCRLRQSNLSPYDASPVYLDTAERLFESNNNRRRTRRRRAPRSRGSRDTFWKVVAARPTPQVEGTEEIAPQTVPNAVHPTAASRLPMALTMDDTHGAARFARFSFDYDIGRLPAGLKFGASSYLSAGYLHEHLCHLTDRPTYSVHGLITPFGISLESTISPEVLLQILPRIIDYIYEYTVGEMAPTDLNGSVNQALRFLGYYGLVYNTQGPAYQVARAAIFEQIATLEGRLENYIAEVDDVDETLNSSMVAFKWAMLEMATLAYAKIHRYASPAAKESARHHILESMTDLVETLLQSSLAKVTNKLGGLVSAEQSGDVQGPLADIHCEAWVCLINMCAVDQVDEGCEYLSLATFWHTVEHFLHESAIERSLHPVVRGETASLVAMSLCALSQFNPSGVSLQHPQLPAHWPIVSQALDNIKSQDFADAYNAMSSPNRSRIGRYIWTILARYLNMATRWEWPILDQSKLLGKLFDILDSRQLQDFSIDGQADFPAFLSTFTGSIPTQIHPNDTVFHLFLRILSQTAFESSKRNDRKASSALARIAMRIMPMREYLPYPRHTTAGKPLDRSVLVNHCALLVVLAVIDPSTSDRRFAKLKTILDFVSSDARARQDYLKAIMFMGIVYKIRGIDLTPVLSWLAHTAEYLCQTYCQCAKRRATLHALRRKAASAIKSGPHKLGRPATGQASAPISDLAISEELHSVNRDMGETAVMDGLLVGAVQQIMLVASEEGASDAANYPSLAYLNASWTTKVLSSPMARDPVAGLQVLQCIHKFLGLRNEYMQGSSHFQQGESQDEFGDMDFDYDDPALNAILGVPNAQSFSHENVIRNAKTEPDPAQLDRQFIEFLQTSITPQLYAILSDLCVTDSVRDSGVPDLANQSAYIDHVTDVWASCAVVLVQKNQRAWAYYMEAFGKESWQRFSDVLRRWVIGCAFSCLVLAKDPKAYKNNRNIFLEVFFRRLAAPEPSPRDAEFLVHLLKADPPYILWQALPFEVNELSNEHSISVTDLTQSRMAILRAIFSTCQKIFARQTMIVQRLERSAAAVCREQEIDDQLLYSYLGSMMSSMRDFLDYLKNSKAADETLTDYAAYCRQVVFLMKEEIGSAFVKEHNIPAMRLLAGVINGTIS